ncbi:MAG: hypothetical protein AAF614_27040 [Chloroflexota bacterium]
MYTQVRQATQTLLTNDDPATIQATIQQLHGLFSDATGVRGDQPMPDQTTDTFLPNGRAISPGGAAACLLDLHRTVQFLRGTHAAIEAALQRFPEQPIHIVYAGCGPFALLLLPLTTIFSSQQIQISLIDIHKMALDSVRKLVADLSADEHIYAYHQLDATTYAHPPHLPLHMVVSETMAYALQNEPQVAVMRHLAPQLTLGGFLIPQAITIDACLSDPQLERVYTLKKLDEYGFPLGSNGRFSHRLHLGTVLKLDADTLLEMHKTADQETYPLGTLTIPPYAPQLSQYLHLTHIQVFEEAVLTDYQSGLTDPRSVGALGGLASGTEIQFHYAFAGVPGIYQQITPS